VALLLTRTALQVIETLDHLGWRVDCEGCCLISAAPPALTEAQAARTWCWRPTRAVRLVFPPRPAFGSTPRPQIFGPPPPAMPVAGCISATTPSSCITVCETRSIGKLVAFNMEERREVFDDAL